MATQVNMFRLAPPRLSPDIDLRCAEFGDGGIPHADLIFSDPPWGQYTQKPGQAHPDGVYKTLSLDEIAGHIGAACNASEGSSRLALWWTWPLKQEVDEMMYDLPMSWRYVTGGAWHKTGVHGPGFHWAGNSEPVSIYRTTKGKMYRDTSIPLKNSWRSRPGKHSRKPVGWQAEMIRKWVPPGGLVLDMYAGLGSVATAVLLAGEGRRYVGWEIDPCRHEAAVNLVAQRL